MICGEHHPSPPLPGAAAPFLFDRDTFSFCNELHWIYTFDDATGQTTISRREPAPQFAHRCFVLVRAVRQFLFHARFEPTAPPLPAPEYRPLIREILSRSPRKPTPNPQKMIIPGYAGLRALSAADPCAMKLALGGAWQSYVLRSHWRMVFPISEAHQERTAQSLFANTRAGRFPIVHLVRFPQLTINHGVLLFSADAKADAIEFHAVDPNEASHPVVLTYETHSRTFHWPRSPYWPGGMVKAIEIYRNWLF